MSKDVLKIKSLLKISYSFEQLRSGDLVLCTAKRKKVSLVGENMNIPNCYALTLGNSYKVIDKLMVHVGDGYAPVLLVEDDFGQKMYYSYFFFDLDNH